MTYKAIGDSFSVIGDDDELIILKVKAKYLNLCDGCFFYDSKKKVIHCDDKDFNLGACSELNRPDNVSVVFERVYDKNVLIKENKMKSLLTAAMLATAPLINAEAKPSLHKVHTTHKNTSEERQIEIVAKTIYTEARGESYNGKLAVATTIYNRSKNKQYSHLSIPSICKQYKQFSAWNTGEPVIKIKNDIDQKSWNESVNIATSLIKGTFKPLPELDKFTHYYNPKLANPSWAKSVKKSKMIGNHRFVIL